MHGTARMILFICSVFALNNDVIAAPLLPSERDSILQQQSELLRREQIQREEIGHSMSLPDSSVPPVIFDAPVSPNELCIDIHRISLDGATLIKPAEQQKLLSLWLNRCLDMAQLSQLTDEVTNWYVSRRNRGAGR